MPFISTLSSSSARGFGQGGGVKVITRPDAPTIGTATATGATTATVSFIAPTNNGGSAITSYTATSSPGGITGTLNQAGSGTITVSGLSSATSYTFTVTATNAIGTSAASSASNSITTSPNIIGQAFGGGYYAGQIGVSSVATHYLIVGPVSSAEGNNKQWKNAQTSTAGTSSVIDGPANSTAMNNGSHPAAQFCKAVSAGGFSDWYMPAQNELEVCYYNLKPTTTANNNSFGVNPNAVPARASNYNVDPAFQTSASDFQNTGAQDFSISSSYWSSTEGSATGGRYINFNSGYQRTYNKELTTQVRAVRRVAV